MKEPWYLKQIREYQQIIKRLQKALEERDIVILEMGQEIKSLKETLKKLAEKKSSKRPKFPDYSLKNQEKKGKNIKGTSTGRISKKEKFKQVTKEINVYPEKSNPEQCYYVRDRIVNHLIDGKKEVVLYKIYRDIQTRKEGKVKNVFGKLEYGIEVIASLAFLIHELHLSYTQAIEVMRFFTNIEISSAEIDILLERLSKEWEKDFNTLTNLVLLAMVVYIDETGWKIAEKNCYTWVFRSLSHTVFLYGEKRNEEVLDRILPRKLFTGTAVTDCYRLYVKRFEEAQKCWAHFLRDAIKLMLLYPEKEEYKTFFEDLLMIFKEGKQLKADETMNVEDKKKGAEKLKVKIKDICIDWEKKLSKKTSDDLRKYVNLQKRLRNNIDDLFVFVTSEAEPTSNEAERALRSISKSRNNYQTSKTKSGAKRKSIITSILASLKQNIQNFSFETVTKEILKWNEEGTSLFQEQLEKLQMGEP